MSLNAQSKTFFKKSPITLNDFSDEYLSEIGINNENDIIWENFFYDKSFKQIQDFLSNLPLKSSSATVQNIIHKILTTKKKINRSFVSADQDKQIFDKIINLLFETGRLNEIDLFYSQTPNLENNLIILTKMIEGNFLRNRHSEACKILENKVDKKKAQFGKILVVCDILNNNYDEARFGLALLKEQNNPGDIFFIELAYSLMTEEKISESDYLKTNLTSIKELNPIIMTSLQFADISPSFDQIENLNTSGLLFILASPSVEIDLKIHCAELLAKQKRISNEMLSEAYQLSVLSNKDLENSMKLYKTLSPIKARPLLYQSILRDKNPESKFEKTKALLKISINDMLFDNVAFLVNNMMSYEEHAKSPEDALLISKMLQSEKKFSEAKSILKKFNESSNEFFLREISINLNQYLSNGSIDNYALENNLHSLVVTKNIDLEFLEKIFLVMSMKIEINEKIMNLFSDINFNESDQLSKFNLKNFLLADFFLEKKDYFNSLNLLFSIMGEKNFSELSTTENFLVLLILKKLGLNKEFDELLEIILL